MSTLESNGDGYDVPGLLREHGETRSVLKELRQAWTKLGLDDEVRHVDDRIADLQLPLLLFVVGEGNFGKSSLINALVGRQVAPTSVLPRTWKVDIFRPDDGNGERTELVFRGSHDVQVRQHSEAQGIIGEEEARIKAAHRRGKKNTGVASDLRQATWYCNDVSLPQDVALVDTPGFAQLRADVSLESIAIRSASGIRVETSDPFEYWYHRADVVLWTLKATKLNDRDTYEALKALASQDKQSIGVITHMDRIPGERWDEVVDEARRHFGEFLTDFIPVVAHADKTGYKETIDHLKAELARSYFATAAKRKNEAVTRFLQHSGDRLLVWTRAVHKALQRNTELLRKALSRLHHEIDRVSSSSAQDLQFWISSSTERAQQRAKSGFSKVPETDGETKAEFLRILGHPHVVEELNRRLSRIGAEATTVVVKVCMQLEFLGMSLGRNGVEPFIKRLDTNHASLETLTGRHFNTSVAAVGSFEVATVGAALGAIGYLVFGPVGWLAGLAAFVFADDIKRAQLQQRASEKAPAWFHELHSQAAVTLPPFFSKLSRTGTTALHSHFESFCGVPQDRADEEIAQLEDKIIKKFSVTLRRRRRRLVALRVFATYGFLLAVVGVFLLLAAKQLGWVLLW